jgi:hypothetical protein
MTRGVILFWAGILFLVAIDFQRTDYPRVEPPPFALGSGEAASGGHCSGR